MPKKKSNSAPEQVAKIKKEKGVPRSYLEYRRTRAARDFLSKDPAGLNLTKLVNYLIQEHAKSKGWVCPEDFLDDDI